MSTVSSKFRFSLRRHVIEPLQAGSWWHPRYYEWLAERKRCPELANEICGAIMRQLRYSPVGMKFLKEGHRHLVDHDLTADSLVLDVGAYIGEWSRDIYNRYQSRIIAFEPYQRFSREMSEAFANEPKVSVHSFGLSNSDRKTPMEVVAWGTTEFVTGRGDYMIDVEMRDVRAVFEELQIEEVDLLKINIEGGEFVLLERMLECGLIPRCRKIMVQFHEYVMPSKRSTAWRKKLVDRIEETHAPVFSFPFVWEGWSLRQPAAGNT